MKKKLLIPVSLYILSLLSGAAFTGMSEVFAASSWTQLPTTGPVLEGAASAYDTIRQRGVLFGGTNPVSGFSADTWQWDGSAWTKINVSGPSARSQAPMAFDAARGRIVMQGGYYAGDTYRADTLTYDGLNWTSAGTEGPGVRADQAMTYDSLRQRVILFGGSTIWHGGYNDTWAWDGSQWTLVSSTGPSPRMYAGMTYDAARDRIVLFGGQPQFYTTNYPTDTWEWDGTSWRQVATTGPSGRSMHKMVYDPIRQRVVLFGGVVNVSSSSRQFLNDTWEWDGIQWTQIQVPGPTPRGSYVAFFDPTRHSIILHGGWAGNGTLGDTWEYLPSSPADLAEGLVAYYPFNGNANDESGQGNQGIIVGATLTEDRFGNAGRAYYFDGVDDYINIGNDASLKMIDGLSISAWIKMASYPVWYQNIISDHAPNETSEGAGKLLRFHGKRLQFVVGGIYGWGTATYAEYTFNDGMLGQWQHVVGTYDRNNVRLFLNGALVASLAYNAPLTVNSNPVLIGKSGFGEFLHGTVDDVRIYNRALSATDIQALYSPVNTPPTANAGLDQTVHVGVPAVVDGSGSADPDGNTPLSFVWSIIAKPQGSIAALPDPSASMSAFTPDIMGDYTLQLVVTDSLGAASAPDTVVISTTNSAPVADAGADQLVISRGTVVQLHGAQSFDDNGDALTYMWSFVSKPEGSHTVISAANTAMPSFIADVYGQYVVQLVVRDSWSPSAPDTVVVTFGNVRPVANAGTGGSIIVGDTAVLDGSLSADENRDPLTYQWSITSVPEGSQTAIADPTGMVTALTPDIPGTYVIQLVVSDGALTSDPVAIQIQVIALSTAAIEAAQDTQEQISVLPPDPAIFKNTNMQNSLINKINAVIVSIEAGNYQDALGQLHNDILGKTDGCAASGSPDKNDWIIDCPSQHEVYPYVLRLIDFVQRLL